MHDVTVWLIGRFGPGISDWIAEVPAVAARLAARWGMRLGELFAGGASSLVLRCEWPDGTPAVLKLSPDGALIGRQVEMLRVFAGSGRVPAVLAADPALGAMVLEEIVPGTVAEELPPDSLPMRWGALLSALHGVVPPESWPWDLRGRCAESFARVGRRLAEPLIGRRVGHDVWQRATRRCHTLLDTQTRRVLLHGDLHLGNVLDGGTARGLVAIDPKACLGDPCFDAVDYVVSDAGHEGIESRCARVAGACGLDGDRLYAWSQVIAPFFAIARLSEDDSHPVVDELLACAR
ncbi:aminoglycoside phosphotransferase family protein [Amycolatopsis sp. GM8]|uniref:aminoglycoside phosphotransferase family protein n=1 Tax=Amycolatopsis sp. GM8 TaxID=2896530 RepID=UPI001F2CC686|nr:aminoglycoside phosphotransferase family protein [Amycolatopsis sp. GM8]